MNDEFMQCVIRMMPRILQSLKRFQSAATVEEVLDDLRHAASSNDEDLEDDLSIWDVIHETAFAHLLHYGFIRRGKHGHWRLTRSGEKSKWPEWSYLTASIAHRSSTQLRETELPDYDESSAQSLGLEEMSEHKAQNHLPAGKEFDNPTLTALHNLNGSASNHQIYEEVIRIMGLSESQCAIPHKTSISLVTNRIQWSLYHLKYAEYLRSPSRAVYELTEKGNSTEVVDADYVRKLSKAKQDQRKLEKNMKASREFDSDSNPSIQISEAETTGKVEKVGAQATSSPPRPQSTLVVQLDDLIQSHTDWQTELFDILHQLSPATFERFIKLIFGSEGIDKVELVDSNSDGDISGTMASTGFLTFRVSFKFLRGSGLIGMRDVEDFRRSVRASHSDKGLLITTGGFTQEARRESERGTIPAIELIDGQQFIEKLREKSLGVTTRQVVVEQVVIDPDFFANI